MGLNRKNCVSFDTLIEAIAEQMCKGKTEQEIDEMYKELDEGFKAIKEHRYNDVEEEDSNDT